MARRCERRLVFGVWCLGVLVAPPVRAEPPEVAVKAALQEYVRNLKAMDASALAGTFTADGQLLEPNMKALQGPAAIQAFLSSFTGVRIESTTMEADSTEVWASDALQWGSYAQRVVVGEKPAVEYAGRFVAQWSRQATGKWLLRRLMMQPVQQ